MNDIISSLSFLYKKRKVYLVGGTVRDLLIKRETKDFDIFVVGSGLKSAREFQKKRGGTLVLLDKRRDEARVVLGNLIFDFNGGADIESDLRRRDFTINSMGLRLPWSRIIDPCGGKSDLRRGIIRTMSDKNISDDPLRILRAFRFKSLYLFHIHRRTGYIMKRFVRKLDEIARERVKSELFFILKGENSWQVLMEMENIGLLSQIIPGFRALSGVPQNKPYGDLILHSINTVKALEEMDISSLPHQEVFDKYLKDNRTVLKLACLLHDIGKPKTIEPAGDRIHFYGHERAGVEIIKKLKLSKDEFAIINRLIIDHMRPHLLASSGHYTRKAIVRLISSAGETIPGLLLLCLADEISSSNSISGGLINLTRDVMELLTKKEEFKDRLVTGNDLIALGFTPGPIFREILERVEAERLLGNLLTKSSALSYIEKRWKVRRKG